MKILSGKCHRINQQSEGTRTRGETPFKSVAKIYNDTLMLKDSEKNT